ncbi:MAG: aldo/keto reductase [Proteobacteria bacterium]|nr:aldo/keto reductase [Pseudomonadota bacterium]
MKYKRLGSSELDVSEICLGTMTFGEQNSEVEAHQQLDYAVSRGVNFFDAAEMYAVPPRAETQGSTERYVGSWLKKQARDKQIIATKITAPGRGGRRYGAGVKAHRPAATSLDGNSSPPSHSFANGPQFRERE